MLACFGAYDAMDFQGAREPDFRRGVQVRDGPGRSQAAAAGGGHERGGLPQRLSEGRGQHHCGHAGESGRHAEQLQRLRHPR